jgi:predicted MFS family arabinose efflux permease
MPLMTGTSVTIEKKAAWNAIFAVSLCVAGLITAEFLPASLLTPMARDLRVTEGTAGQAISVTAITALFSSLFIAVLTKQIDRRKVLMSFSILLIISCIVVAFAPNFIVLLTGRVILGVGLGGFWAMSTATAMRLVPEKDIARALSIIFGALSIATVVAAPLGSYLGGLMGWRNVFLIAGGFGMLAVIWQYVTLPPMPTEKAATVGTILHVLKRRKVKSGMLAVLLLFIGQSAFFSYIRPFLESVTRVHVNMLSAILLAFGISNFVGTTIARYPVERSLKFTLIALPMLMSCAAAGLVFFGDITLPAALLISLWGFAFGIIPVGWSTWLTQTVPDEAETGGGLLVGVIQLAISLGAIFGGILLDMIGAKGVFATCIFIMLIAAMATRFTFRKRN